MSCRSFNCGIVAASFPSSRSSSLAASPASLADALPAFSSCRLRGRRSARHIIAAISSRRLVPVSLCSVACLARRLCPIVISLVISGNLLACRPASRFSLRRSSRFSARLSFRSPLGCHRRPARSLTVPFGLRSSIAPPCLSRDGERDGTESLSRHRLPALPPLLALGWRLACVRFLVAVCLLACRHLCLYCDGEIVYMICPVVII